MNILGIETSCDETGVALYSSTGGLLAHQLYSQIDMHADYGGVVPELASRDHVRKLLPLIDACLRQAKLQKQHIDGIAYTAGPGLIGALLVGATTAKALALGWGIPVLAVHHLEGHLLAPMLDDPAPAFPFVALLVSGGHTQLMRVDGLGAYTLLGETLDDAAGEAFDKTAQLLNLGYPGGPKLAALAEQGDPERFVMPRPMLTKPNLNFSFSGLKTHVRNTVHQHDIRSVQDKADIARGFEEAAVATLVSKSRKALRSTGLGRLVVAGGVGANQRLRQQLKKMAAKDGVEVYYPRSEFCTDNGAMIAYCGWLRLSQGQHDNHHRIKATPRWPLDRPL